MIRRYGTPTLTRDLNESTGNIGDRDRCAAGRACDACADEETRGSKGDYTGGGRDDGRDCEEGCAGLYRGIRDRGDACGGVCGDVAQRVGGGTGDDERRERSLAVFLFVCVYVFSVSCSSLRCPRIFVAFNHPCHS